MLRLLGLAGLIDRGTERIGHAVAWLALAMVALGSWNALARYLGRYIGVDLSSNAYIEAQWQMGGMLVLLSAAWTLADDSHVRVDVLYGRVSARAKAWIDLVGTVVFLIPFSIWAIVMSWGTVASSWKVREMSPNPDGLPVWPLKAMIPIAFALLIVQGISWIIHRVAFLRGLERAPGEPPS